MIEIIDNFLEEENLIKIHEIIPKLHWQLHGSYLSNLNFFAAYSQDITFKPLWDKIVALPQIKITDIPRFYMNCNPSGKNHQGDWHIDLGDGSNMTALFYPCDWDSSWGGSTLFKGHENVEYKKNRLVLFDGDIEHKADKHTSPNMRFSIAFKLEAEWNNK